MLTVVKIGGAAASTPEGLDALAQAIGAMEGPAVVVHGGGAEISRWQEKVGLPVEWKDGLRVTTPDGMQVTAMVLSGWMNKRIVQALLDRGEYAAGVSGEDAALLVAERKQGGALGEVGTVVEVNVLLLRALLSAGIVPVVSPVSRGPAGAPLNVNADEAAIAVALGVGASRLLWVSDVPGVRVGEEWVAELTTDEALGLIQSGTATGGMRVKLEEAIHAARGGMEVVIGDESILNDPRAGTRIRTALAVAV